MADQPDLSRVRAVAQHILDGLGDRAPDWRVLHVAESADILVPSEEDPILSFESVSGGRSKAPQATTVPSVLVVVGSDDASQVAYGYFPRSLPEPQAIAQLASHLQDGATEHSSSFGEPLPPCPGHQHPLSPEVVDGVAVWVCPATPAHHRRPILA